MANELYKNGLATSAEGADAFISSCLQITGNVFWVDSVNGNVANPGTEESPKALLSEALTAASSTVGDIIVCKANHVETVGAALTISKPVMIFGLGSGTSRPSFTIDAAGARLDVTSQHVSLVGLRFPVGSTAINQNRVQIAALDVLVKSCDFLCGANDAATIELLASADGCVIDSCTFEVIVDGPNSGILVSSATNVSLHVKDCSFDGGTFNWDDAGIFSAATHEFIYERPTLTDNANIIHTAAAVGYVSDPTVNAGSRIEV